MKSFCASIVLASLVLATLLPATAATKLFPGYARNPWGTDANKIMKEFPKGNLGKLGESVIYKQSQPNKEMRQRTFAFKNNRLNAVTVSFSPTFVKKTGIESLLNQHKKSYGEGTMDRTNAPHLISYVWEDSATRITFAYAPKRLDMTILMFQQK